MPRPDPAPPPATPPRLVRFLAEGEEAPAARWGAVTADEDGVPVELVDLGGVAPELQGTAAAAEPFDAARLQTALVAAERVADEPGAARWDGHRYRLEPADLARRLLSPVPLGQAELDRGERHVLGAGLNFRAHRAETRTGTGAAGLLLFPKPTAPTGAYAPVPAAPLLDFEVEIALVLLADLDLRAPPRPDRLLDHIAFALANDVSDRKPIILDPRTGYTHGKGRPGFLPLGPWLVSGRHLPVRMGDELGEVALELALHTKPRGATGWTMRQQARSTHMIAGPLAILRAAADARVCMLDAAGTPRHLHPPDGVLRAGSLILTGTPGGTAIRAPGPLQKLALLVRGGFSRQGAAHRYLTDQVERRAALGYLGPGDAVEASAPTTDGGPGLGRQRWHVAGTDQGGTAPVDRTAAAASSTRAGSGTGAPRAENDP